MECLVLRSLWTTQIPAYITPTGCFSTPPRTQTSAASTQASWPRYPLRIPIILPGKNSLEKAAAILDPRRPTFKPLAQLTLAAPQADTPAVTVPADVKAKRLPVIKLPLLPHWTWLLMIPRIRVTIPATVQSPIPELRYSPRTASCHRNPNKVDLNPRPVTVQRAPVLIWAVPGMPSSSVQSAMRQARKQCRIWWSQTRPAQRTANR